MNGNLPVLAGSVAREALDHTFNTSVLVPILEILGAILGLVPRIQPSANA
jgi:hypothetical protein